MSSKQMREIKELSVDELKLKVAKGEQDLFESRIKHRLGQLEKTASLWMLRKNMARMKMLLGQKTVAGVK